MNALEAAVIKWFEARMSFINSETADPERLQKLNRLAEGEKALTELARALSHQTKGQGKP